ncbi:MAG: AAA family ATPase [Proteobacteria bacterium]|nr:AAA family ATPase [Pseudomonadota bacterium]
MYEKYYGFNNKPFEITPDPRFFYLSENHKEALAHLRYAIREGKGFSVVTGEVGTGKTTLVHMILSTLDENVRIANIFNPLMEPDDFLDYVCVDLGIREEGGGTRGQNITLLYHFLLECFERKDKVFLIIDEAQNLDKKLLEEVRLLTNLETSRNKLLHVILLGQPELNKTLADEKFRALKQRITTRYNLNALNFAETQEYILFRLKKAGARNLTLFDNGAVKAIYKYSKGIPRLINIVCDNALITAFSRDLSRIRKPVILETIRDLEGLQKVKKSGFWPALFIIFIVLVCAILIAYGLFPDYFMGWIQKLGFRG